MVKEGKPVVGTVRKAITIRRDRDGKIIPDTATAMAEPEDKKKKRKEKGVRYND